VHSTQLHSWKKQALASMSEGFSTKRAKESQDQDELIEELYKQIGQLKVELDWMKKKSELFS
jgi:transposase-like protein